MVNQDSFDFKQQVALFWQKKYYFIVPFLLICMLFLIGSYRLKRIYKSSSTILVEEERAYTRTEQYFFSNDGLQRLEKVAKIKGMILSYEYLKELIRSLELDKDKMVRIQALATYTNMNGLSDDEIVERWILEYLRKNIQVESQRTEFITIAVEHPSPEKAYLVAKTISQIFIEKSHRNQLQDLEETLEFTNERQAYYQNKIAESEKKLQNYRMGMVQDQIDTIRNAKLSKLKQLIQVTNTKINELEKTIKSFDQTLDTNLLNLKIPDNSITKSLKNGITDIATQIVSIFIDSDLQDIRLMRLNEKLNLYRSELLNEYLKIIKTNLDGVNEDKIKVLGEKAIFEYELELMGMRRTNLQRLIDSQAASAERFIARESTISLLQQELETNREMYNMFLQRTRNLQTETAFQQSEGAFTYKIIEPAYMPLYPEKPNKPFLMIIGAFLGTMAGLTLILIVIFLDHSFHHVDEVETYLQLPVLGTVSKLPINNERPVWKRSISVKNVLLGLSGIIFLGLIIFSNLFWKIFLAFLNKIG